MYFIAWVWVKMCKSLQHVLHQFFSHRDLERIAIPVAPKAIKIQSFWGPTMEEKGIKTCKCTNMSHMGMGQVIAPFFRGLMFDHVS